ncbi:hypothetical protein D6D27_05130 [Aureobasidium pullulans]|nr:hypothetical protein D6D27_05130 [Aureobasidium pullulans]
MVIADHTSDEDLPNLRGTSAAFEYIVRPRLLERKYTDYYYPRQTWDWNASSRLPTRTTAQQTSKTVSAFKVAVPIGARNFGILLIDDKNKRRRNEAAVQYGLKILELCDPSQFTVDVRYSKAMETDVQQSDDVKRVDAKLGHRLLMLKDKCDHSCKFLVRFLHEHARNDPSSQVTNASARSDWAREKLLDSIASCDHLEFCHLYNLTSSDDGAEEFKGEFEFKERDNIRSALLNMKWTRRADEV